MRKGQFTQLGSVLLLILIVVGSVLFVLPMRDTIAELKITRDSVSDELQGLQSELESLEMLAEDVGKSEATKTALLSAVPSGYSQDALILELYEISDGLNFDLNAMNFSGSVDQELGDVISVSANFSGSYDDLIDFLQKLENADRLMQVTSLSVQLTSTEDVVFNLNIEAYYQ